MDTLILVQDDKKLNKMVKEQPPKTPSGILVTDKLEVLPRGDPAAAAALGDAGALLGAALISRIRGKIVDFADRRLADEPKRPHPQDVATFQIVFIFHQTCAEVARAITQALERLPFDQAWKQLPDKHVRALRVTKVWLLSCESAADVTGKDPRLLKYIGQSARMRIAASAGLRTEKRPPPSTPPEFFPPPSVHEFSTGNPVTGGLKLHPNAVQFVQTPNWEVTDKGVIQPIPGTNADAENPSGGTVYKWDGAGPPTTTQIPANGVIDILNQP